MLFRSLLKEGRTSLRLKAEAVGRKRDSEEETIVAEGEFTFVALDEQGKPRPIPSPHEGEGGSRAAAEG